MPELQQKSGTAVAPSLLLLLLLVVVVFLLLMMMMPPCMQRYMRGWLNPVHAVRGS